MNTKEILVLENIDTPLLGANVTSGSHNGSVTNFDGVATVTAIDDAEEFTISYIGFVSQKFAFIDLPDTIILKEDANVLDTVIITVPKPNNKNIWYALGIAAALGLVYKATRPTKKTTPAPKKKSPRKVAI